MQLLLVNSVVSSFHKGTTQTNFALFRQHHLASRRNSQLFYRLTSKRTNSAAKLHGMYVYGVHFCAKVMNTVLCVAFTLVVVVIVDVVAGKRKTM